MNNQEANEIIKFYALWSGMLTVLTIMLRPFISVKQILRDCIITFLVSFLCGLCMEYFDIPVPVKCGLSGIAGLFAILIYGIIVGLLTKVRENPKEVIETIKELNDGRNKPIQ